MSKTVTILQHVEVLIDGNDLKEVGSRSTSQSITIDGVVFETRFQLTNESGDDFNRQVVWQDGDSGVSDFDVLVVESDADVLLELTIDREGTPEYATLKVYGDVPFILASDDMVAAITVDGSSTTMDQIDQIAVKNNATGAATSNTATVRVVLLT